MFQKKGTFSCQCGLWPDRVESVEWSGERVIGVEKLKRQRFKSTWTGGHPQWQYRWKGRLNSVPISALNKRPCLGGNDNK